MKKEFCTKFCDVLIWFHKVMKLQSFEFSIRDAIHANVKYISPVVSIHIFVSFTEKGTLQSFMEFLTIFHKLMKLGRFEWLNCLGASDMIHANLLIMAYMVNFWNFWSMLIFFMITEDYFLRKICYFGLKFLLRQLC